MAGTSRLGKPRRLVLQVLWRHLFVLLALDLEHFLFHPVWKVTVLNINWTDFELLSQTADFWCVWLARSELLKIWSCSPPDLGVLCFNILFSGNHSTPCDYNTQPRPNHALGLGLLLVLREYSIERDDTFGNSEWSDVLIWCRCWRNPTHVVIVRILAQICTIIPNFFLTSSVTCDVCDMNGGNCMECPESVSYSPSARLGSSSKFAISLKSNPKLSQREIQIENLQPYTFYVLKVSNSDWKVSNL